MRKEGVYYEVLCNSRFLSLRFIKSFENKAEGSLNHIENGCVKFYQYSDFIM